MKITLTTREVLAKIHQEIGPHKDLLIIIKTTQAPVAWLYCPVIRLPVEHTSQAYPCVSGMYLVCGISVYLPGTTHTNTGLCVYYCIYQYSTHLTETTRKPLSITPLLLLSLPVLVERWVSVWWGYDLLPFMYTASYIWITAVWFVHTQSRRVACRKSSSKPVWFGLRKTGSIVLRTDSWLNTPYFSWTSVVTIGLPSFQDSIALSMSACLLDKHSSLQAYIKSEETVGKWIENLNNLI